SQSADFCSSRADIAVRLTPGIPLSIAFATALPTVPSTAMPTLSLACLHMQFSEVAVRGKPLSNGRGCCTWYERFQVRTNHFSARYACVKFMSSVVQRQTGP